MFKTVVSSVNAFLVISSTLTIQADDVSITNPSTHPVQFRVFIPTTGYNRMVTLQPKETQNAIGTDLWHNALVEITGIASNPDGSDSCLLYIEETTISDDAFYLPKAISRSGVRACPYTNNLPNCGCFKHHEKHDLCLDACTSISNAQVFVSH